MNRLIRECFLAGVSPKGSGGEVLAPSLDAEVHRFHTRPLSDHYCYLLLDGITLKVKGAPGVKKRLVLCAYGITPQGKGETISFRQAPTEREASGKPSCTISMTEGREAAPSSW